MNGIITVSLSPVIDIHYSADNFIVGKDNIVKSRHVFAAGKAMNVSRGLHAVGISAETHILLGEENASEYLRLASDYAVPISCITTDGAVRENISVNTPKGETRICLNNYSITPNILPVFAAKIISKLSENMAVVFSGSLPKGITCADFVKFVLTIKNAVPNTKIVLDCPTLTSEHIKEIKPFLIKPNYEEALKLLKNLNFAGFTAEDKKDAENAAKTLCIHTESSYCVISCGASGAAFASKNGDSGYINAPKINNIACSTVGAGDSMLAGMLFSFLKENSLHRCTISEAVKWGVAFGSASCLNKGTEPPIAANIFKLYREIN